MPKTKRSQRYMKSCWQKVPYDTMQQAMKYAQIARLTTLGAYECKFCKHWHLGNTPKGKQVPLCHDAEEY